MHWKLVSRGVLKTSLDILNEGGTIALLNHTYIALILKVEKPRKVIEYSSLCKVIYRMIAKTITNRFKYVLHHIISLTQSAFILEKLIIDNIIIGNECLHKIMLNKAKKTFKNGLMALKLDISKAYDRVEWNLLKCTTIQRLGFFNKMGGPYNEMHINILFLYFD